MSGTQISSGEKDADAGRIHRSVNKYGAAGLLNVPATDGRTG